MSAQQERILALEVALEKALAYGDFNWSRLSEVAQDECREVLAATLTAAPSPESEPPVPPSGEAMPARATP